MKGGFFISIFAVLLTAFVLQLTLAQTPLVPKLPNPMPAFQTLDQGQSGLISVNDTVNETTAYQWYMIPPGSSAFSNVTICAAPTTTTCTISTSTGTATGLYIFMLQATRGKKNPKVTNSSSASVTVNPQLTVSAPTASSIAITQGQTSTISDSGSTTGTSPYSYQWFESGPGGDYSPIGGATGLSYSFSTTPSTPTGVYYFELQVSDSASTPMTITSLPIGVTVNASSSTTTTTTTTTSSTTSSTTTINSTTSSTSTTTINSTTTVPPSNTTTTISGYGGEPPSAVGERGGITVGEAETFPSRVVVGNVLGPRNFTQGLSLSNVAQYDSFSIELNEVDFSFLVNYITPDYIGITFNGRHYDVHINESLLLYFTDDDLYYLKLTNISIVPALDTVRLEIYRKPIQWPNETIIYGANSSTNLELETNTLRLLNLFNIDTQVSMLSPENTSFAFAVNQLVGNSIPAIPLGYNAYIALNLSSLNKNNNAVVSTTITTGYDCDEPNVTTEVIAYGQGGWRAVSNVAYNKTSCELTFTINSLSTIAVIDSTFANSTNSSQSSQLQKAGLNAYTCHLISSVLGLALYIIPSYQNDLASACKFNG